MKRLFDIILSAIGLSIFFPLSLFLSLAIKLEDGGPIFYSQERVGKGGKIFKVLKFRSMIPVAKRQHITACAQEDDAKATGIGRILRTTAMDELPQLLSILKGNMSFVGPRPLIKEEISGAKDKDILGKRSMIRPGLTGVTQILIPRDASLEEKFSYDLWYVKNRSLSMDVRLILISFLITLFGRWEAGDNKIKFLKRFNDKVSRELGNIDNG